MTASTYAQKGFKLSTRGATFLASIAVSVVTWIAAFKVIILPVFHAIFG